MANAMACQFPPPLTDDQLFSALEGEADATVWEHLRMCSSCRRRFDQAHHVESLLRNRLERWDCPTSDQLADYHLKLLPASEVRRIDNHVANCPACQQEIQALGEFLQGDFPAVTEPASSPAQPVPSQRPRELYPRRAAGDLAHALRGLERDAVIMFEVNDLTLFLEIRPAAKGYVLVLRLVADDLTTWRDALIRLRQGGELIALGRLDEEGSVQCALDSLDHPISLTITASSGWSIVLEDVGA